MTPSSPAVPAGDRDEAAGTRREILAWAMYDWANSAYSTLSITLLVAYLQKIVFLKEDYGATGAVAWAWGIALSMLTAAVLSPILGAIADAHLSKRRWLAATALGGAACAMGLALVPPSLPWAVVAMFFLTSLLFEQSLGFYNGFLPEIADERSMNRVSAWGYGLGYIGGGLALVVAVLVLMLGGRLGLPDGTDVTRDYNQSASATFAVGVPHGRYEVALLAGDPVQARGPMRFSVESTRHEPVRSAAGEWVRVEDTVEVSDGQLTIHLAGASDDRPAIINELTVRGVKGDFAARFDFGNSGSPTAATHVWVSHADRYRQWNLKDEKGFDPLISSLKKMPAAPPPVLAFGWTGGEVTSGDPVTPQRLRIGLFIMGAWWGLFSLPTLLVLRDRHQPRRAKLPLAKAARAAIGEVRHTLRNIRAYRTLALFLVGFLFYNDGVQTVLSQSPTFAIRELNFDTGELIGLVLMIQFLAMPGALFVGWVSDRLGQKRALVFCLAVWVALVVAALLVTNRFQFWILGAVLALVMGGIQAVSRAVMGMMTPPGHTAEFFGFFNLSGKATSFLGTFTFGAMIWLTGSARYAIVSLIVFFVIGWLLVARVDVARGRREAIGQRDDTPP